MESNPQGARGDVPAWVDEVVDSVADEFAVATGPGGILLLRRRSIGGVWRNARETDLHISGEREDIAPYMQAVYTRLRDHAGWRLESASLHPLSSSGAVQRVDGIWTHIDEKGNETHIGRSADCAVVNMLAVSGGGVAHSVNPAPGVWKRVIGTLDDATVGYACVKNDPLKLVVPCPRAAQRDVMVVMQNQKSVCVVGFRIIRKMDDQLEFAALDYTYGDKKYFALLNTEKGKQKLRVLRIPQD